MSRDTWEIFGDEEWEDMRRKAIVALGFDTTDFEIKEIEIKLDRAALEAAVATPVLSAEIDSDPAS